jgi:hypothetical protein
VALHALDPSNAAKQHERQRFAARVAALLDAPITSSSGPFERIPQQGFIVFDGGGGVMTWLDELAPAQRAEVAGRLVLLDIQRGDATEALRRFSLPAAIEHIGFRRWLDAQPRDRWSGLIGRREFLQSIAPGAELLGTPYCVADGSRDELPQLLIDYLVAFRKTGAHSRRE